MPKVSNRAEQIHVSPFRKLSGLADAAKQQGKYIYHLNIGQPDILTPPAALAAVRNASLDIVKYAPAEGLPSYRKKLLAYYQALGIQLDIDQLIITTGASEALYFLLLACLEAGEEVIIPEPLYANYLGFSNMADVVVKPITSSIDNGFKLPDLAEFEAAIGPATRAIMICNPNNPTGCLYSEHAIRQLAALAVRHDLFLIVDEVYREFCYDGQSFFSVLELAGAADQVIVVDSISKRYSSCGARIGAIISRNPEVIRMAQRMAQLRLSAPVLGQLLAEAALDAGPDYLEPVRGEYERRRDYLVGRLQAMSGVTCHLPGGAFYAFAKLPIDNADHFCKWLLTDFDHHGKTLMVAPGTGFYASPGMGLQEIRFAYVLKVDDLKEAMDCLEAALVVYPGKQTLPAEQKIQQP